MEMSFDIDIEIREQVFHNAVREYIIFLLLFILLYVSSYAVICLFKKKPDSEDMFADEDDAMVYRIALWICTLTLATSAGAVLLLPISIISNEVLHLYPKSYYVKWLNSSLIHGLWNQVFLLSNVALFIFLPFAYFFTESEGFSGTRKGLRGRVYETVLVLGLVAILVIGLAWVASAIMNDDDHSKETLFDVWNIYLPYLYSCISFLGVLVLLLCTPYGFTIMFTVMGQLVIKPKFLTNLDEELSTVLLEEEDLLRKIDYKTRNHVPTKMSNGHTNKESLTEKLELVQEERRKLERRRQVSSWRRNLGYPLVMLLSLALTVLSVLMVVHNTFQLLIGIKALPVGVPETVLGLDSLSALGPVGAALEIIVILYLMLASLVGFFRVPYLRRLQPKSQDTPMQKIIGNCIVILVLSSALPILSKTLGITNFDLIGNFGSMDWLGNFYIILTYNVVFAVATGLCLFKKFTATVRHEIYDRLISAFRSDRRSWSFSSMNGGIKED